MMKSALSNKASHPARSETVASHRCNSGSQAVGGDAKNGSHLTGRNGFFSFYDRESPQTTDLFDFTVVGLVGSPDTHWAYYPFCSTLDSYPYYSCTNLMSDTIFHLLHCWILSQESITGEERRNGVTVTDKWDFLRFQQPRRL